MKLARLLEIVFYLLAKKQTTAKILAEHFEVSIRTIYRDIDSLTEAGIPIYTTQGKGGGISLLENFTLNKTLLTEDEQNDILIALQNLDAVNFSSSNNIFEKLSGIFGKEVSNWIYIDFSYWNDSYQKKFEDLKHAILNKKIVNIDYFNSSGIKTKRNILPTKLLFKGRYWYVIAYCFLKDSMRIFKVNRIQNIILTNDSIDFELKENNIYDFFLSSDNEVKLKLEIDKSQSFRIYDEFEESQIKILKNGNFLVDVSFPEDDWLYGFILSFAENIKIIEPQRIKTIILKKLEQTIKNFS